MSQKHIYNTFCGNYLLNGLLMSICLTGKVLFKKTPIDGYSRYLPRYKGTLFWYQAQTPVGKIYHFHKIRIFVA